jgi:hypothetical protein
MSEQAPSKDLSRRLKEIYDALWVNCEPMQQWHAERLWALIQELNSAPEPPAECAGCEEFVRMQHDIASLLGVDEDTDSISLHGRIYGALSQRATQPPAPHHMACVTQVSGGLDGPCDCGAAQPPVPELKRISDARLDWSMTCECTCSACTTFDQAIRSALTKEEGYA